MFCLWNIPVMVTKSIPINVRITECCLIKGRNPFELTEKSMKTDTLTINQKCLMKGRPLQIKD